MSYQLQIIISVLVLLFYTASTSAQRNCSDAEIERCHNFSSFETNVEDTVIMRWISEDDLTRHCLEYEDAKRCIDDFEHLCHPIDRLVFFGRDLAYDWLCEDATQTYLDNQECFLNAQLHIEGQRCNNTLSEDLDSIDHDIGTEHSARKICLYANNYLDCIENAVMSECPDSEYPDIANWQREFDMRALEPLLSVAACQIRDDGSVFFPDSQTSPNNKDDGLSTTTYIIVACVIAMSVIIIVVLVLMILQVRKQRKQREMRRECRGQAHFNNALNPSVVVYANGGAGAMAGPLPEKGPLPPPAYDSAPPPTYSAQGAQYEDLPSKSGAPRAAPSVAGSTRSSRTQPPDYASRAGSVYGDGGSTRGGGAAPSVISGVPTEYVRGPQPVPGQTYLDMRPDDGRSVRSHSSSRNSRY